MKFSVKNRRNKQVINMKLPIKNKRNNVTKTKKVYTTVLGRKKNMIKDISKNNINIIDNKIQLSRLTKLIVHQKKEEMVKNLLHNIFSQLNYISFYIILRIYLCDSTEAVRSIIISRLGSLKIKETTLQEIHQSFKIGNVPSDDYYSKYIISLTRQIEYSENIATIYDSYSSKLKIIADIYYSEKIEDVKQIINQKFGNLWMLWISVNDILSICPFKNKTATNLNYILYVRSLQELDDFKNMD